MAKEKVATVREIVGQWLKANGYEGLCSSLPGCGCEVADLMPCGSEDIAMCEAGYKVPCPGPDDCELDGDCPFHIVSERPEKKKGIVTQKKEEEL